MAFENVEEVKERELHILWTNADRTTAENMVFMYSENSMKNDWWDKITVILWGATQELVVSDAQIRDRLLALRELGVNISACLTCANKMGIREELEKYEIEIVRWGKRITDLMQAGKHLLSI